MIYYGFVSGFVCVFLLFIGYRLLVRCFCIDWCVCCGVFLCVCEYLNSIYKCDR